MAELTRAEKAERYDALQAAISFKIETYEHRKREAETNASEPTIFRTYHKGAADAYADIIQTLKDFTN